MEPEKIPTELVNLAVAVVKLALQRPREVIDPRTIQLVETLVRKRKYVIDVEYDDYGNVTYLWINGYQIEPMANLPPSYTTQCHVNASSPLCTKRVYDGTLLIYQYNTAVACPPANQCPRY